MSGESHALSVVSSFLRPGRWVECSCGWASPDLQFPTDAEAIEWARQEHLADAARQPRSTAEMTAEADAEDNAAYERFDAARQPKGEQ